MVIPSLTYQHFVVADIVADVLDASCFAARHRVGGLQLTDVDAEVGQHLFAVHGQIDLRMELDAVDVPLFVVNGRDDFVSRLSGHFEAGAEHGNTVAVRQQYGLEWCETAIEVYMENGEFF